MVVAPLLHVGQLVPLQMVSRVGQRTQGQLGESLRRKRGLSCPCDLEESLGAA